MTVLDKFFLANFALLVAILLENVVVTTQWLDSDPDDIDYKIGGVLGLVWFAYLCEQVIYIKFWMLNPYKKLLGEAINPASKDHFDEVRKVLERKRGRQEFDGEVDSSP